MISPNCAFPTLYVSKNGIIEVMEELEISIYKKWPFQPKHFW